MADKSETALIAIAIVAVVAVAGVLFYHHFAVEDNTDEGDTVETYWYYLNFGDNDTRTGWYSGTGHDAAEGLSSATTAAGFDLEINSYGYIASIDGASGDYGWSILVYMYDKCDEVAQTNSVLCPNYDAYNTFIRSNGWASFYGYDSSSVTGNKLSESCYSVFYMGMYAADYSVPTPITDEGWKNGGPFASSETSEAETQTYWYYLNFGYGDSRTGWYSADATDAGKGLEYATSAAGMSLVLSGYGYVGTIDGVGGSAGWAIMNYQYSAYDQDAINGSIAYVQENNWGSFICSNGWMSFSGYDWSTTGSGNKMAQSASTVFYLSVYDPVTWAYTIPADDDGWRTGGPFPAASAESGDTYWYYLNFGDSDSRTGWYSGTGSDAAAGLVSAAGDMKVTIGSDGSVATIGGVGTDGWYVAMYTYANYDQEAQTSSIVDPQYSAYYLNGWQPFNGYSSSAVAGNLMFESCYSVFYMAPFEGDTPTSKPNTDTKWMNEGPFSSSATAPVAETQTYWFFLNFGAGDNRNGWYTAEGTDATVAFNAAMSAAKMEVVINASGYVASIDGASSSGGWSIYNYMYSDYSQEAIVGSIANPDMMATMGMMFYSDGWFQYAGYGSLDGNTSFKLSQSDGTVFYMSMWEGSGWLSECTNPVTDDSWKIGGPFTSA